MVIQKDCPVYVLTGSEQLLKEEALSRIKATFLDSNFQEFNLHVFYPDDDVAPKVLECACNAPFMGGKRVVVVRQCEALKAQDQRLILGYAQKPFAQTILVLEINEDEAGESFLAALRGYAQVISCVPLEGQQLLRWIENFLKKLGKKIEPQAQVVLIQKIGANLGFLSNALESLSLYIGQRETVQAQDVQKLVGRDLNTTAFELFEAIKLRQGEKALRVLDDLFKDAVHPAQILGALAHSIIAQRQRFGGMCFSLAELEQADSDIKFGRTTPRLALELLVVKLLNAR